MERFTGILGVIALMGIAYALSTNRRAINWRTVAVGVGLQLAFALIILRTGPGVIVFEAARTFITNILGFTDQGAHFIFGNLYLTTPDLGESVRSPTLGQGFEVFNPATGDMVSLGTIFAIHVLPTIIFFASLMALLYHLGIMQMIVRGFAWLMKRTMKTSGSESLCAASNIFVGQTEAPFVVKPFLRGMTRSEIMAIMTTGFATVAGGVLAAYVRFGIDAGHLLAASVMSAPAALVMAKIIVPEIEESETRDSLHMHVEKAYSNPLDAAAGGASDGLRLAVNVAAMLIAFIALIAMINGLLGWAGGLVGVENLSLRMILGYLFSPLALLMGVSWSDALDVGSLLGAKVTINEFVAFIDLSALEHTLDERSFVISTYALTGFANFSSIAIQIGGISALVPERRKDLARYGLRAMIAGTLASWQTAAIAGILI
ncbi:MAG: putative nucleoside permease NupX [Calditrichaeota bacterium]|nr:putative nucleoside permease NupX [Calditrichota bacterium]